MRTAIASMGLGAVALIAAGIDPSLPLGSALAAILELIGIVMAVAFVGSVDGV